MDARKYIGVFCGSSNTGAKKYEKEARELAKLMVENGYDLIFGGANAGLMKIMADEVIAQGGAVKGIITPDVEALGVTYAYVGHEDKIAIIKENDLPDRKKTMIKLADAFITLPGGLGTYDELGEVGIYNQFASYTQLPANSVKPCCVFNIDGFYDGTIMQLKRGLQESFIKENHFKLIQFFTEPKKMMSHIIHFKNPKANNTKWWEEKDMPMLPDTGITLFKSLNFTSSQQGEVPRPWLRKTR